MLQHNLQILTAAVLCFVLNACAHAVRNPFSFAHEHVSAEKLVPAPKKIVDQQAHCTKSPWTILKTNDKSLVVQHRDGQIRELLLEGNSD